MRHTTKETFLSYIYKLTILTNKKTNKLWQQFQENI